MEAWLRSSNDQSTQLKSDFCKTPKKYANIKPNARKKYLTGGDACLPLHPEWSTFLFCWMDRWPIWTLFVQNWKSKTGNLTRRNKCWISLHHQPDIFKYLLKLARLLSLCPLCDKRIVVLYKFTFVGVYLKATRSMRQMTDASFESTQCSFPALRRAFVCQRGTQGQTGGHRAIWQMRWPPHPSKWHLHDGGH